MSHRDRAVIDAILRTHFESFLARCILTLNPGTDFMPSWHIEALAYQLDRIRRGEINRLIINVPPRNLKSLMVSVAFPAFLLGHEPWHRIFVISYGDELAAKHSADHRSIVESGWFQRAFPRMQIEHSHVDEVATTLKGFRKSTSVYGPLTGLGGNIFIIDDPQKPVDAMSETRRNGLHHWYSNTLLSRLDNKETGVIIVVMQRVHLNDLSGYLSASGDWTVLSLPAIAETDEQIPIGEGRYYHRRAGEALHPAYESIETLRKLRRSLTPEDFAAQYQQNPVPLTGGMIKRSWLRYHDKPPERTYRSKIIQSWDTAAKDGAHNDWSVCTTWLVVDKIYYLLDLVRDRFEYPLLRDTAVAVAARYKPDIVLIEDASTGIALAQDLQRTLRFPVKPIPIERDKVGRLYVQQAKFSGGLVYFPKGAPFLPELEAELLAFPQGKNDDQVDSISQALAYQGSTYTLDHVR